MNNWMCTSPLHWIEAAVALMSLHTLFYTRQHNILCTCLSGKFAEITGNLKMFVSLYVQPREKIGHWSSCTIDYVALAPSNTSHTLKEKNGFHASVSPQKDDLNHSLSVHPCTFASNWVRTKRTWELNGFFLEATVFSLFIQKISSFEVHLWHNTNVHKFSALLGSQRRSTMSRKKIK